MNIKRRLVILQKLEKHAQVVEETQDQVSNQDEKAAQDLFDQLFDQVFREEASKV